MNRRTFTVPGHTLVSEGAPYVWRKDRWARAGWTVGGDGKGLCSCGATSEVLKSSTARRTWHRAHKEEILQRQGNLIWTSERVKEVIETACFLPLEELSTHMTRDGKVLVTMSFDDLCSFAEQICGSMSEFDLDGFVKQELVRQESLRAMNRSLERRSETDD